LIQDRRSASSADVVLGVPAEAEYLRAVRMTVAALATQQHFNYDDVEDLRRAVDELCYAFVVATAPGNRLRLLAWLDPTEITVQVCLESAPGVEPTTSELSERIIANLVDEYYLGRLDHQRTVGIVVKRAATPGRVPPS
jgi:hypothetical protein